MRQFAVLVGWFGVACASTAVPVVVRGAGAAELVLAVRELQAAAGVEPGCFYVGDAVDLRELRRRLGGDLLAAGVADHGDVIIVVVRPAGERLSRIEVATEEGVDVLTLSARATEPAAGQPPSVWLLRLQHRPHQLAVVVRSATGRGEQTVGIFDPQP